MARAKWLVLWSLWLARLVRQPTPPVPLSDGRLVRGQWAPDGSHKQFFGIPYATTNSSHRFQAPGPEPAWEGVFEAVDEHVRCPQLYALGLVVGREDCLRLNVYAPHDASPLAPSPVMVFMHGGGFKEGSSARLLYGPDYLVAKGVVLVTINYRLSVLGFLCLGIEEAPGNAGMKDQVAALRWVQRNIRAFGGDPDNVTIFGESAGGASVSYHVVSPTSRGLFHRAIAQSGSSLAPWAEQHDPVRQTMALAEALGGHARNVHDLYGLLKDRSAEELLTARIPIARGQLILGQLMFTPCTERRLEGVQAFLTESPFEVLRSGAHSRVPMIVGSNDQEGYYFGTMESDASLEGVTFESALPHDLKFPSRNERLRFTERLKRSYGMDDGDVSLRNIVELSRLHGEPFFSYPAAAEAQLLLNASGAAPLFSYVFSYDGWRNFPKWVSGFHIAGAPGASHADELFYLFRLFPVPTLFEGAMIDTLTTMWTNFAKYGDPTPAGASSLPQGVGWPPSSPEAPLALLIDGPSPSTRIPLLYSESLRAWHDAYSAYRSTARGWRPTDP